MFRILCIAAALSIAGCAAVMASNEPSRSDAMFAPIRPGMTTEEVRSRLGPPDEAMPFPRSGMLAWEYRYQDPWGYMAMFSVTFGPDGQAVSKFSRRINDGGDRAK